MKFKTSELTGRALEIAVDLAHGYTFRRGVPDNEVALDPACRQGLWRLNQSGDRWACMTCLRWSDESADFEGIIRSEGIAVEPMVRDNSRWVGRYAFFRESQSCGFMSQFNRTGATPREAAFRCFVASRLGDEVDVLDELLED